MQLIYDNTDHQLTAEWFDEIVRDLADREMPIEARRLGRLLASATRSLPDTDPPL